ncbi:hypothetical protein [Bacillus sp. FJAT-52991]|uniref:Uncharacterized protein n=1 Tax=Bacillus kandeliae TaxID=3129297 RepID=A0ABZ2N8Z5_9BACI
MYGLDRSARDKGNTMNVSESMLTYRKEERGSPLVAGACSWTKEKRKAFVQRRQADDGLTKWRCSAMQSGWHLTSSR